MIRYGIIGTGWIAKAFVDGTLLGEEMRLAAVCSRDASRGEAFAAPYGGAVVYTDPATMAESDINAVYIASPNFLHPAQARLFLEHGKHVICEKPITVIPEELEELQALARSRGLVYLEAIMMMHLPARQALQEAVSKIGRVTTAHLDFSQLSSKYPAYLAGQNPNIFNPACCTGSLMDLGIYCVYPALDLFGMPEGILASAGFLNTGADGWGTAVLQYPGLQVTLTWSKVGQARQGSQILGDEGTVTVQSISCLTGITRFERDGTAHPVWGEEQKATLMGAEASDFCRYIQNPADAHYQLCQTRALEVSRVMAEIRRLAGISFPGYEEAMT